METNSPRQQLDEVARLQTATTSERYRIAGWSMPVLTFAAALLLLAFATQRTAIVIGAVIAWNVFNLVWGRLIRRPSRARGEVASESQSLRNSVIQIVIANAVFWPLFLLFGYKTLIALGALYVAYLAYMTLGELRPSQRRLRALLREQQNRT